MKTGRWAYVIVGLWIVGSITSCAEPEPRTARQIDAERSTLPKLCLTKSGKEVIVPADQLGRAIVENGQLAFPAYVCSRPNCTGEGKGGRPFLFIWADPTCLILEDGTLGTQQLEGFDDFDKLCHEKGIPRQPTCPACLEQRDLGSETEQQQQEYRDSVAPYVLPETARRIKELDEEYERRLERLEERRNAPAPKG